MSKWFESWQEKVYNKKGKGNGSNGKNVISHSKWVDNESDEDAFAAYVAGQAALAARKKE